MSSSSSGSSHSVESLQRRVKQLEEAVDKYKKRGDPPQKVEQFQKSLEETKQLLREAKKEAAKPKPHPALQFGPVAQTVAIMCTISLGMSVVPLPWQMLPFYILFSRLTILAVICLVLYSSIIWYGYNSALVALNPPKDPNEEILEKLDKMMKPRPDRPDLWANNRAHPSAFLTTRHAPPRLFPFPLGKSRPEASVRDELWWEGGNAPHVGHFNRTTIPEPGIGSSELKKVLMERAMKRMEIEKQRKMWHKRIQSVQILCVVIALAFINKTLAIVILAWLIYSTLASEIDGMLAPPEDMTELHKKIKKIDDAAGKTQSGPRFRGRPGEVEGGMSYIFGPNGEASVEHVADVPIAMVPPHVLMTTNDHLRAGPGAEMEKPY
ncbi:hypothetical protein BCR39DRAFT_585005 [Naematelia encephala]|uniref:Uncharacterized protein n=1 Tax=Naematelia encephala TaxID=71784 RepID=A0A1Y2BKS0_9TREE|nr:hypothetical protein BCR39DRAFT_585005 [Naematelia encephala]